MEGSKSSFLKPKTLFFWNQQLPPPERKDWVKDWESCFSLKASEVYRIITKRETDTKSMRMASKLLKFTADNCAPPVAGVPQPSPDKQEPRRPPPGPTAPGSGVEIQPQTQKSGSMHRNLPESTMQAIDAVYVVVCVLHDLKSVKSPSREKLDARYASGSRQDGISDVIKLWNQLPLPVLESTVDRFPAALQKALDSLKSVVTMDDALTRDIKDFKLSFGKDGFRGAVDLFCWYYSPFHSKSPPAADEKKAPLSGKEHLLDCLYSTLVDASPRADAEAEVVRPAARLPKTATQLVKSGFALGAPSAGGKIKAQFSKPTLQVPAVVFDAKLETVVTNLLEWERTRMEERPVARYLILLGDLVADEGDARVLERAGVLRGVKGKKEREVVEFLRRVKLFASCSSAYPAIDDEVEKLMATHDEKMGWLSLRNRPAVVLASTAVLVSLVMAAVAAKMRKA